MVDLEELHVHLDIGAEAIPRLLRQLLLLAAVVGLTLLLEPWVVR